MKLNNDGFDLGAQRREIEGSEIPEIIRIIQKYHSNIEAQTSDEEIIHHPLVTIANKEKIAEQDYILVGERYKIDKPLDTSYPVVPLSNICEINAENKNPALAFGDDEFIYIDISSVENGTGKVDFSNKIKGTDAPSRAKRAVKKGDILFSTVRPNLKAYGYVEREDCDCCVASTGFAVISAKNMVLSKYVYYMLYSEPIQTQLAAMMGKGAYPSVNQKDVSQIQIPLPPLSTQEDFVAELDSYQKIIDGARQVVENYKSNIRMDSSWAVKPLGQICDVRDGTHDSPKFVQAGFPLVTSKNIKNGTIVLDDVNFISKEDYDKINQRSKVDRGDILMPMIGTIGNPVIVDIEPTFAIKNVALIKFHGQEVNAKYVLFVLNSSLFAKYIESTKRGGTQNFISLKDIRSFNIPCPTVAVQEKIIREIEEEVSIVEQNKRLIAIFEQKMADKISEIWGEKQ